MRSGYNPGSLPEEPVDRLGEELAKFARRNRHRLEIDGTADQVEFYIESDDVAVLILWDAYSDAIDMEAENADPVKLTRWTPESIVKSVESLMRQAAAQNRSMTSSLIILGHEKPELKEHLRNIIATVGAEESAFLVKEVLQYIKGGVSEMGSIRKDRDGGAECTFWSKRLESIGAPAEFTLQIALPYDYCELNHNSDVIIEGDRDDIGFSIEVTETTPAQEIAKLIDNEIERTYRASQRGKLRSDSDHGRY